MIALALLFCSSIRQSFSHGHYRRTRPLRSTAPQAGAVYTMTPAWLVPARFCRQSSLCRRSVRFQFTEFYGLCLLACTGSGRGGKQPQSDPRRCLSAGADLVMPTLVVRLCDDGGVTWRLAGEGCAVGMGCTMYEGDHDAMKAFFDPLLTWSGEHSHRFIPPFPSHLRLHKPVLLEKIFMFFKRGMAFLCWTAHLSLLLLETPSNCQNADAKGPSHPIVRA